MRPVQLLLQYAGSSVRNELQGYSLRQRWGIFTVLMLLAGALVPAGWDASVCLTTYSHRRTIVLFGLPIFTFDRPSNIERWMLRHGRPVKHKWALEAKHRFVAYGLKGESELYCFMVTPGRMDAEFPLLEASVPTATIAELVDGLERGEALTANDKAFRLLGKPPRR